MAGIGFELRRLTQREDLMGVVQGYMDSALVSSGPWLFTVLAVAAIHIFSESWASPAKLADFRIAIIYSFSFSLVLTGPVMLIATRYLADKIYGASVEQAPGMVMAFGCAIWLGEDYGTSGLLVGFNIGLATIMFTLVSCVFLVANATFTYVSTQLDFEYYGYGYFLSCLVTLLYAYAITSREVLRLPYLTFVLNNASVR